MGSRLIKDPAVRKGTWPERYRTLENLASAGAEAWYPELRFYGFGVERFHQLKVRRPKPQANHELRLNHVVFLGAIFALVRDRLKKGPPLSQPYIANPEPHGSARRTDTSLPGFRTVAFDRVLDGTRMFCGCARSAHDRMRAEATERTPGVSAPEFASRTEL